MPTAAAPHDMLSGADLSIVVQGPIKAASDEHGYATTEVLASARRHYPQSEILYSSWEGTDLPSAARHLCDRVLFSIDPGPVQLYLTDSGAVKENINRQIVSTVAGLRAAKRSFAMKLRADTMVIGNRLPHLLDRQNAKPAGLVERALCVSSQYTRFCYAEFGDFRPCLGHLSDLFFFGLRQDLLRYWDGPPVVPGNRRSDRRTAAMVEQILGIRFLVNCGYLPEGSVITEKRMRRIGSLDGEAWLSVLHDNFAILDSAELGVAFPRRFQRHDFERHSYESDRTLDAAAGRRGPAARATFWLLKGCVFAEFRAKEALRRVVGDGRALRFNRIVRNLLARASNATRPY